jgi:hypothetical protein
MRTILYRRWAPAKSPVKIEFPPDILHDIRAQSPLEHDRGYLFGRREGNEVRVSTAIRTPEAGDPRTTGTEPVGLYITRARGEVFLTDADLEQVDRIPGGIALVIAGGRAGFFAREADGSIQAVRSHEEFLVADAATQADPLVRRRPVPPAPSLWKWALGATGLLAAPVAAFAYLRPLFPSPIELSLRETNGQLVIQWDRNATTPDAFLEITEAEGRTRLPVPLGSSSVTYAARSGDVEILLSTPTRSGRVHWTSARFVPPVIAPPVAEFRTPDEIQEDMDELRSQAAYLRQAIARRQAKVQQLSAAADRLLGPIR